MLGNKVKVMHYFPK